MARNKIVLLPLLCMLIFAQSCVHGDLEDCPPMVQYAVAFQFTQHMRSPNPDVSTDLFYNDVKKINLYVFDKQELVYITKTAVSPYATQFNIPLDLPMGNYHIIAWGDLLDNQPFDVLPEQFVQGVTTLNEARLKLHLDANNRSSEDFDRLFYGEKSVSIPMYISKIDTVSLINDSHNVRVVVHWDHSGLQPGDPAIVTYSDIHVQLYGEDAVYDFENQTLPDSVFYDPVTSTKLGTPLTPRDHELRLYPNLDPLTTYSIADSACYEFRVLRLIPDENLNLVILQQASPVVRPENLFAAKGTPERFSQTYGPDLVGDTGGTRGFTLLKRSSLNVAPTIATMQRSFDRYENYRVDVMLKYERQANTYLATWFSIQDWHTVGQKEPGWAD